ncbi:MAG: hypothetical protein LW832_00955 [Parachlamydia sp.]|jgi:hypothetical protein|nr:hypothetical protein [Parachlamydia sp.]
MINQLNDLHAQFSAVLNTDSMYLNRDDRASTGFSQSAEKTSHLYEIFRQGMSKIEALENRFDTQEEVQQAIDQLQLIQIDSDGFYTRYCNKTNTWVRWLLKKIPLVLRRLLPKIFDHGIERAEAQTRQTHLQLNQALGTRIRQLRNVRIAPQLPVDPPIPPSPIPTPQPPPEPPPAEPTPTPLAPSMDQEAMQASFIASTLKYQQKKDRAVQDAIIEEVQALQKGSSLTMKNWHQALDRILTLINTLPSDLRESALVRAEVPAQLIPLFLIDGQKAAYITNNLYNTQWDLPYAAATQVEEMTFNGFIQSVGLVFPRLINKKGRQINPRKLNEYKGAMKIEAAHLAEYAQLLEQFPSCRPDRLEIEMESIMTAERFRQILALKEKTLTLTLSKVLKINLAEIGATQEEEQFFLENLQAMHLPDLLLLQLAEHDKKHLPPALFSNALKACPKPFLMKECFSACSNPDDILLPTSLTDIKNLDLQEFSSERIEYLLKQWSPLECLKLGPNCTEETINEWIKAGFFHCIQSLDLSECSLSTDILFSLNALPSLWSLRLPELTKGDVPLDLLPKFDNPFKIKQFYTQASITRTVAGELYTGLPLWATLFEIPLARLGTEEAILPNHTVLDPLSVTYWLYQNDFRLLATPQLGVQSIVADACEYVNDDNLIEFLLKFPNAREVSLYNSPHITDQGIAALIEACPQIEKIDCSGCLHVTDALFNAAVMKVMHENPRLTLNLSGTSVTTEALPLYESGLEDRIILKNHRLKIIDEQLTDEGALEAILQAQDLAHVRHLDLSGCTQLTDEALSLLLDRLNTDQFIFDHQGGRRDNPQRLNLISLNLFGCSQITLKAFDGESDNTGKIQPKILNTLQQIGLGKTSLWKEESEEPIDLFGPLSVVYDDYSEEEEEELEETAVPEIAFDFSNLYPQIEKLLEPQIFTHKISPADQLEACFDESEASNIIHNRMAIELFANERLPKGQLLKLDRTPVDVELAESMSLYFKDLDDEGVTATLPRLFCYSYSGYIRNQMRKGELIKAEGVDLVNQNAAPKASETIINMMQGKDAVSSLDWKTAYQAAELAKALKLPLAQQDLLKKRVHSQFEIDRADDMFFFSRALNDLEAIEQFEDQLCMLAEVDYDALKDTLYPLCEAHNLKRLRGVLDNSAARSFEEQEKAAANQSLSTHELQTQLNEELLRYQAFGFV